MDSIHPPSPQPYPSSASPVPTEMPPPQSKNSLVAAFIAGAIVFVLAFWAWSYFSTLPSTSPTPSTSTEASVTVTPSPSSLLNADVKKIVFTKNSEVWIMDTDGMNAMKLNLPGGVTPLNNISNGWVYYRSSQGTTADGTIIYAYNYVTNQSKQISELSQPNTLVNVDGEAVSPDSKIILYHVSYTKLVNGSPTCGQEQCPSVDLYPDHMSGRYVYHIETDTKQYLGSFSFITQWDGNSQNIFTTQGVDYHEYKLAGGYYSIDTTTGVATRISVIPSKNFYIYYRYHLQDSGKELVSESVRSSSGAALAQNGVMKVIEGTKETTVDTGNICTYSTCLSISPDAKYAVYTKNDSIMLLDVTALTVKEIAKSQGGLTYNHPTWISSSQILAETINGVSPNDKHNLISVDVSGTMTSLTTSDDTRMW